MKTVLIFLAIIVVSYLIGSINPSIIISKLFFKKDIRTLGSGNAGATNLLRNFGAVPALFALIMDFGKAVLAVFLGELLISICGLAPIYGSCVAAFSVVFGHVYPIYFKFKGGKGVLTIAGSVLLIHPWMLVIALCIFGLTLVFTKYVSLGSIFACSSYCVQILIFALMRDCIDSAFWFEFIMTVTLVTWIVLKHRKNIVRIFKGTERKITDKKKPVVAVEGLANDISTTLNVCDNAVAQSSEKASESESATINIEANPNPTDKTRD
ncbi:MAG: glycerol-3-phosphate 1-O-acyltransferase PlsY [Clostridia bacterium]